MPRSLISIDSRLPLLLLLYWPLSEVMAGPIITASTSPPGLGLGSQREPRSDLTARLLTAVGTQMQDASGAGLGSSSEVGSAFPRGLSDLSSARTATRSPAVAVRHPRTPTVRPQVQKRWLVGKSRRTLP